MQKKTLLFFAFNALALVFFILLADGETTEQKPDVGKSYGNRPGSFGKYV